MRLMTRFWVLLPIMVACGSDVGPRPNIPDSATVCEGACTIMRHFSCEEGLDPDCVPECEQVHSLGYIWPDDRSGPECVVEHGHTIGDIRACNVECEVVR